jgi:hypothetical protein
MGEFAGFARACGHHLIGAKAACTRFAGILNCELPKEIVKILEPKRDHRGCS